MDFCHLHVHTEYSLLDGAARINRLVPRVKELGMEHLAMTDHGVMYGTVEFYKTCKQHGVHPVIGCEVYVAKNMDDKQGRVNGEFAHLILLCENNIGYQNLIYLVSQGFLRGYYYRPRIDYDLLEQHSEGLICLSACLSGDIPSMLLDGNYDGAKQLALRLQNMFGKDNFYIELMNHGIREEVQVLPQLAKLARELGIGMVATNDAHYINREDAQAQDVLMCIQTGKFLDEDDRMKLEGEELYIKSRDEMHELFSAYEGALENTVKIAERCNVDLDFETQHLPEFTAPEGYTNEQYLAELVMQGFGERYTDNNQAYERAVMELRMISNMGFVDYFLVVWDFIRFAKENGIPVGPGRGSAAGSVVAYSLGITDVDPLKYGLMFERFLNPERITMPDIDIDFCYERRQEVIDYVIEKYGTDHVAQIITFGTMAARAVVRDVGRVMRIPYGEVDRVAKMIPFAIGMTIDKALDISKALAAEYAQNAQIHELIDTARKLEGLPRHSGTHAAGVVISKMPLVDIVPLQKNDETVTTQFSMGAIEELGLLKMDFLGLRNLTVIEEACCLVEKDTGQKPDMAALTFDDDDVYKLIAAGETDGIFQMESAGMRQMLRELQPNNFEDIIASISLYRPGPMDQIPKYVYGKHHPEKVTYLHDSLRPILDVTYGCMVYQEQVMQIVRNLAGYSLARSDLVRRAMSKKKADVMAEERRVFIHGTEDGSVPGAVQNGVPETIANQIFDQMIDFAQYAFNKSHAAAYGVVAYRTAWLKVKHPVQYMAALLNSCQGAGDKAAQYIVYCRKHGIEVLPPDVNHSGERFEVQDGKIRFGLGAVKNVGRKAIHDVIDIRGTKPFDDFFDFLRRVPTGVINKRMVESLIRAGAFDSMGHKRAQLMSVYERTMDAMAQEEKRNVQGQISLFEMTGMPETSASETLPDIDEYSPRAKLAMEKEMTGIYITGHPLLEYTDELSDAQYSSVDILQANEGSTNIDGQNVTLAGIISERHTKATKANNLMANYVLEDLSASVNLLAFPATFDQFDPVLQPDNIVVISGRVQVREEEEPTIIVEHAVTFQPGTGQLQSMQRGTGGAMRKAAPKKPYAGQAPAGNAPRGEDLPVYTPPASDCTVWLRLRSFDNDFLLQGLLHTMAKYPGNVCVNAHATDKNQTVKLKQTVSPDAELLTFLSDVLGGENVKVVNR